MVRQLLASTALFASLASPALAHIGLAESEAAIGSTFRATLVVAHGCAGAGTTQVRVQIPEGFYNVRAMPKAGWTLEVVTEAYDQPFENHGTTLTEGVKEITWSGGELPDSQFDEFVFRGTFGTNLEAGASFYFPVLQGCGDVEDAWIDTSGDEGAEYPAPAIKLQPATGGQGH
jgi:periplasmic copper chaperone A